MSETRFHTLLKVRITEALEQRASDLSRGVPLDQYDKNVGYCNGLRDALAFCEDVEREFDQ